MLAATKGSIEKSDIRLDISAKIRHSALSCMHRRHSRSTRIGRLFNAAYRVYSSIGPTNHCHYLANK